MKKRLLSLFLTLCLAFCLLPGTALAMEDFSGYTKVTTFEELKTAAANASVTGILVVAPPEEGRILVTEDVNLAGKKLCVESTNLRIMENATLTLGSLDDLYFADAGGNIRVLEGGGTIVIGGTKLVSASDETAVFLVKTNGILVNGLISLPDDAYPVNAGEDGSIFIVGDADSHGGTVPSGLTVVMDAFGDGNTLNVLGDLTVGHFDDGDQNVTVAGGVKFTILDRAEAPTTESNVLPDVPQTSDSPTVTRQNIPATGTAYASTQTVELDGKAITLPAYALKDANGNPTNYVRLRDLASLLNGTAAQFDVVWSAESGISLVARHAYDHTNGSESGVPFTGDQAYTAYLKDTNVDDQAMPLTAFQVQGGGYTYYQLRDLGKALGFNVGWSAGRGIFIETDKAYTDAD